MSQTNPPSPDGEPTAAAGLPAPRPRRRWLTLLLVAVVFFAGVVIGAGGALIGVYNRVVEGIQHPESEPARITARLRRNLRLTDEQAAQVEAILLRHQAEFQEIRRRVQPEVVARLDQVERDIAEVLTPEQRPRWHSRFDQMRRTWIPPMPDEPRPSSGTGPATGTDDAALRDGPSPGS
jgi:cell division protein FtsB